MPATAINERVTKLEMQFSRLEENQEMHWEQTSKMNAKLDELLALRNKGVGVFWIVSLLFGVGVTQFFDAFAGLFHGR